MSDEISDYNIGFSSPHYMLQALVAHADESLLRVGIVEMVNYLVHNEEPNISTAFDILAQVSASGVYVRTYEHDPDEEEMANPEMDPTQRPSIFTLAKQQESAEEIMKRFREQLNLISETDEEGEK